MNPAALQIRRQDRRRDRWNADEEAHPIATT
jgi:hypothetical protein